jgi:hypothetical protein
MTSFVGTGAGFGGRSLHGHIQASSGTNLDLTRDVYRYQVLFVNVITILNAYLTYFTTGNYEKLKSTLTLKTSNALAMIIQNEKLFYNDTIDNLVDFTYDNTVFDRFRDNTFYVLNGMIQALSQYNAVDALQNEVKYFNGILSSEQNIIDYLNANKQASMVAFSTSQVYNTAIVMKPWYERYLVKYGAPNDGVFDNQKMAGIVQELINEGIITLEQFTSNTYP